MITLTNDFHNTEARIRAKTGDTLTRSQVARARRALCGMTDCVCSGALGIRGPQSVEIRWGFGRDGETTFTIISADD